MLAAVIHELGAVPALEQVPEPVAGPGQTLLSLRAAGLNPVDLAIGSGRYYGGHPPVPFVAGSEAVGHVVASQRFRVGARVYVGRAVSGSLAERVVAADGDAWELPEGDDDELAVALGIAGLAGWLPLAYRARLQPGERVLVLGATGSVGSVAVQVARLLGAGRIVAAGRDDAGLERARRLGADVTVNLSTPNLASALREAAGGQGPEVVVDPLWGSPALAALDAAAPGARIVNLGQSAAPTASIPSPLLRGRALTLLGHSSGRVPVAERAAAHRTLLAHARAGRLTLERRSYPLRRAPGAWQEQAAGPRRKLVVVP
jgi:NADPH2:quinone reductase